MKANEIIKLHAATCREFGLNDNKDIRIYVKGEPYMDDVDDNITPEDIWAFMIMVARKQIKAEDVYFTQYVNGETIRINLMENGKTDREFVGSFFKAADKMALEIFDINEQEEQA